MIELGVTLIRFGLAVSAWSLAAGIFGAWSKHRAATESARRGVFAAAILSWAGAAVLVRLLVSRDFRVAYVWEYTSLTLPDIYAFTALWAGQAGSLLFWLCILGVVSTIALANMRGKLPDFEPQLPWIIASIQLFFFLLITFAADPFQLLTDRYPEAAIALPVDGNGLNPQLQNFGMIIHPPLLYAGYIAYTIPFALAMAALASGNLGDLSHGASWIRAARRWSIAAWMILGFGILCGARWAYVELGWGGYWAWDPVENASLMPWLTGTAFLHSVMIEERRGMLRRWNIFLIALTYLLCLFGTFLTRSGILSSVHSFAQSDVGPFFVRFMSTWAFAAAALFLWRWKELRAAQPFHSVLSRESSFLFQNLLLLGICGAVFWGTMYPIISENFTGEKVTVDAPYFNKVVLPLGLALYLLTGSGPLISWRRASGESLRKNLGMPVALGVLAGMAAVALGSRDWMASSAFGLSFFIVAAVILDLYTSSRVLSKQTSQPLLRSSLVLIDRNHRRYGGFLTHIGMAVLLIGLAGNAFNQEVEKHLAPGESMELGHYRLVYRGFEEDNDGHRNIYRANVDLLREGEPIGSEHPEISIYFPGQEKETRNSEVAIRPTLFEDLYIIFAEPDGSNAVIRMMIHPLIAFVWAGGFLAVLGALVAIVPWRFSLPRGASSAAAALVLVLVGAGAHAETPRYTHALGNRDPIAKEFACRCGCTMILHECDHPNCPGSGPQLDEIAAWRAEGLTDRQIIDRVVARDGLKALSSPPAEGFHLSAWLAPFLAVAMGAAGLTAFFFFRRNTPEPTVAELTAGEKDAVEKALKERRS
ncbi:MAG: cytochrome c-type biogenesis CcmF C-terminal domain-containing protein [Candidatus Hydrogenedentota bacterium]